MYQDPLSSSPPLATVSTLSNSAWISCLLLLLGGWLAPGAMPSSAAQSTPPASITLSEEMASSSQVAAVRSALVSAITQGASPNETTALIKRQRRLDGLLQQELAAVRTELAELQRAEFDPAAEPRRQELRRAQSLLWISRVELACLVTELFATGSPDGLAMARQSIELIETAIVSFPSAGVMRDELLRLLGEAQLRSGDPAAAVRTMHGAARSPSPSQVEEDGKTGPPSPGDELVINTPEELAFVIRVDLAKHQWSAAEHKIDRFYGATPDSSPRSTAMDLARLQYLILRPQRESNSQEIGRWLDVIEQRGGAVARQNAETMLARERAFRSSETLPSGGDPRVLRADARYYLRVGKTLPSALLFARAAVDDIDEDRSIDSALRAAAILESDAKRPAAAQLLRQTAVRHAGNPLAPTLMLQAATLLSDEERDEVQPAGAEASEASPPETPRSTKVARESARDLLSQLLLEWPASTAAATARDALIAREVARGQWIEAAELATQLPAEHWNETTATRCRQLWQRAIVTAPSNTPCHWHDQACQRVQDDSIAAGLQRMWAAFATQTSNALAVETMHACTILLADLAEAPELDQRLVRAEQETKNAFLKTVALQRLGRNSQTPAPETRFGDDNDNDDDDLQATLVWRLDRDLASNPTLHRSSASFLLAITANDKSIALESRLRWLMWSGQVQRGVAELRAALSTSPRAGDLLAAAASALADSTRSVDLRQAAALWDELALGIPTSHRAHQLAKVESVSCQWASGDQAGARSAAELMLLTNPPSEESLRARLQNLLR